MGAGGIIGSITTARRFEIQHATSWLVTGFVGCGLSAIVAIVATNIWLQFLVALLVGLFLGSLTVAIVPLVHALVPPTRIGLYASLGVGGAYFLSNIPHIFKRLGEDHCLLGRHCLFHRSDRDSLRPTDRRRWAKLSSHYS